ncbi:MAG TPA: GDSL-type esterase/lipase family protein [Gemmatimonadales bacterium]|nr:GDSL-type esterase/lipase family protein [Gemmatimonadales bacterium]
MISNSIPPRQTFSRVSFLLHALLTVALLSNCSSPDTGPIDANSGGGGRESGGAGVGGLLATGGATTGGATTGGTTTGGATGGAATAGGATGGTTSPPSTGGISASGASGASTQSGGVNSGGATSTGGAAGSGSGGAGTAGASSGSGGANAGAGGQASASGGSNNGGTPGTGGTAGVGGATGGAPAGGAGGSTIPDVALDPSLLSKCTGTNPIRCTIPVPANGNYNVTVEIGSATAASTSRILAELARLETQPIALAAGKFSKQTFSVNVRTEVHDGYSAPGMTLDLVIDGTAPALHGLGFAAAPTVPTLFVAGDSTSCDWDPVDVASQGRPLERGWAQEFSQYLLPGLAVANYADSGDTAGTLYTKFKSRGAVMKAGDFLFIQFGHNDQKSQADVDAFKANLTKFINDARAAGATPILFTPVARKSATTANPGFAGLDVQVRELAASAKVALVDLTSLAIAYYGSLTSAQLNALFFSSTEGTHFSESGATQIAGIVAKNLKASTVPIRDFLK